MAGTSGEGEVIPLFDETQIKQLGARQRQNLPVRLLEMYKPEYQLNKNMALRMLN